MNMLVSVATRETSRREDLCDCYWSCLVITAQFITSETGEKTRRHNAEVSYLVWGCKAGFLVRVNKVRARQRWITLPFFPLSAGWFDHCSAFWHPTLSSFSPPFPVLYFFNHRLTIWRWYASRLPLQHAFILLRSLFVHQRHHLQSVLRWSVDMIWNEGALPHCTSNKPTSVLWLVKV